MLSPHFSLAELINSETASRLSLDNTPNYIARANLAYLCAHVLEPAREELHAPITVTSGYRSPAVNRAVHGVKNSYHLTGSAADLVCQDMPRLFKILAANPYVDLLLFEHSQRTSWLHVQISRVPRNSTRYNYSVWSSAYYRFLFYLFMLSREHVVKHSPVFRIDCSICENMLYNIFFALHHSHFITIFATA